MMGFGVIVGFWVFMLVMDLLVPLVMICFGRRFEKTAPKEINAFFGYRTAMSMKNKETWKFAHEYIGRLWKVCGWVTLPTSAVVMLFALGKDIVEVSIFGSVICGAQIVIMLCTIISTERALKRNFDKNGKRC